MKAPPALKERVTDGAGKPAGSELRWAGEAFGRINPTANAEPMILPFVNWQGLAWRGSHRKPALLPRPSTLPWSIATPEPVQADSFTPVATGGTAPKRNRPSLVGDAEAYRFTSETKAKDWPAPGGDVTQVSVANQLADHKTNAQGEFVSPSPCI